MRGISRFSTENLLSHSTDKLRRGTFLCFTKFLVSKKIMDKRGEEEGEAGEEREEEEEEEGGREGGREFLSKIFCLTVPKNFVGEPFCAVFQKISGSQIVYG